MIIKNFDRFMVDILVGGVITMLTFLFGDVDKSILILFAVMVLDFISGILKGVKNKEVSSKKCFDGICKKLFIIIYVILAHLLDTLLNLDYVRTCVCWLYIVNDIISITENGAKLGVKFPTPILKVLEVMQNESE